MNQTDLSFEVDISPESQWLTVTPSAEARNGLIHVQELGDFYAGQKYYTRRKNLPSYLIKYALSGEGLLEYSGSEQAVRSGQLFFIDCIEPQYYRTAAGTDAWHIMWIHFYGGAAELYYRMFTAANGNNVIDVPPNSGIPGYFNRLLNIYQTSNGAMADILAAETLTSLITEILSTAQGAGINNTVPGYILDARAYLAEHYTENIKLDDLSELFNVNKFHFQKQFKRYVGYSPHEFITLTRLNAAKNDLKYSDRSIGDISQQLGFENISHFISLFKRCEGITPHTYRKTWNSF